MRGKGAVHAGETATEAGGMHPTGLHSCYRLQRSWGKVMFLHVSVIPFTGWVYHITCWDTPPRTRHPPGTRHPAREQTAPGAVHAGRYGQQAGGTHPTGMHSRFEHFYLK